MSKNGDSSPETSEILSDMAKKYRRATMAISLGAILLASLPDVDWSKLPVVGALDTSKANAVWWSLLLLLVALAYNWGWYIHFMRRDWKEWVLRIEKLRAFPFIWLYVGIKPRVTSIHNVEIDPSSWEKVKGDPGMVMWRVFETEKSRIKRKDNERQSLGFTDEENRAEAIAVRVKGEFLLHAAGIPNLLAVCGTVAVIYLLAFPPPVPPRQVSTEAAPAIVVISGNNPRPPFQSFPATVFGGTGSSQR